ncbi:MAG: thioredoxin fold domain-containing protein [Campylobacterota bacterium]|nr:thioredoxin fold domain-containing protein [Campylobacterota bacterium]
MIKVLKTTILVGALSLFSTGCDDKSSKAKLVEPQVESTQEIAKTKVVEKPQTINLAKEASDVFYSTFRDPAKIAPHDKSMILVFGANGDPYTMKLKEDVFDSKKFQNRLKNDFSSYYFKTTQNDRHKLFHEGEFMDVDTKTMILIYGIVGTPTIIFTDKKGKAVILVPGYMPTKQFMVTMDFMDSKKWEGKDRKNGEVYQALKDFYIANGIEVSR